ncbi:hypothetical protein K0M31_004151 [Melipona bicolor]|uniref:Coatomer beta subunit C-terminal domain-containing protein n=1 Tax=Melipona bicolor TaxID=60889 RepID=A0AA40KPB5_9HYME|nr:hypothetical protein K0M31_004151 [Melipona bicolor]
MSSVMQLGRSGLPAKAITHDDAERLSLCLRSLACPTPLVQKVFTEGCRDALGRMLAAKAEEDSQNQKVEGKTDLTGGAGDVFEQSLSAAVAGRPGAGGDAPAPSALSKVTQLTGFSDPVYARGSRSRTSTILYSMY